MQQPAAAEPMAQNRFDTRLDDPAAPESKPSEQAPSHLRFSEQQPWTGPQRRSGEQRRSSDSRRSPSERRSPNQDERGRRRESDANLQQAPPRERLMESRLCGLTAMCPMAQPSI